MRVDVFFCPQEVAASDVHNRVVAIVDVLRASTSIAVALANGARAVIPLGSSEEVVSRGKSLARSEVKLAGERRMQAIPGFDFGNSPLEFTRHVLVISSAAGTKIFKASLGPITPSRVPTAPPDDFSWPFRPGERINMQAARAIFKPVSLAIFT